MFLTKKHLSRRTLLKGAGGSLALPLLDAMIPAATALSQTAAARKVRADFFYLPLPVFQAITLRNVRIAGEGKLTLDGFDAEHPLKMTFDNVILDAPATIKTVASHATLSLGPGPVNFRPEGEDVSIRGNPSAAGSPNSCVGKFVPFPR